MGLFLGVLLEGEKKPSFNLNNFGLFVNTTLNFEAEKAKTYMNTFARSVKMTDKNVFDAEAYQSTLKKADELQEFLKKVKPKWEKWKESAKNYLAHLSKRRERNKGSIDQINHYLISGDKDVKTIENSISEIKHAMEEYYASTKKEEPSAGREVKQAEAPKTASGSSKEDFSSEPEFRKEYGDFSKKAQKFINLLTKVEKSISDSGSLSKEEKKLLDSLPEIEKNTPFMKNQYKKFSKDIPERYRKKIEDSFSTIEKYLKKSQPIENSLKNKSPAQKSSIKKQTGKKDGVSPLSIQRKVNKLYKQVDEFSKEMSNFEKSYNFTGSSAPDTKTVDKWKRSLPEIEESLSLEFYKNFYLKRTEFELSSKQVKSMLDSFHHTASSIKYLIKYMQKHGEISLVKGKWNEIFLSVASILENIEDLEKIIEKAKKEGIFLSSFHTLMEQGNPMNKIRKINDKSYDLVQEIGSFKDKFFKYGHESDTNFQVANYMRRLKSIWESYKKIHSMESELGKKYLPEFYDLAKQISKSLDFAEDMLGKIRFKIKGDKLKKMKLKKTYRRKFQMVTGGKRYSV